MADMQLDPKRLAEAQVTLETVFGDSYIKTLEERSGMISSIPENKYKEEVLRAEKANEQNYNDFLACVRTVRHNLEQVEGVAKALNAREVEVTQNMGIENNVDAMDTSGLVRM